MSFNRSSWGEKDFTELQSYLVSIADPDYARFIQVGAVTDYPVIGCRSAQMTAVVKEILEGNYEDFLANFEPKSREELHILAWTFTGKMSLNFAGRKDKGFNGKTANEILKETKPELFSLIKRFDSWEYVDGFCARMKCVKKAREDWLKIIDEMLGKSEFFSRTALVLLLDYYVDADYLQVVFERILQVKDREEYYVKMAVAWFLQKCYAKYPDLTYAFMKNANLPEWTLRKTVSKIQDSYQIEKDWKLRAKSLLPKKSPL